MSQLAELGETVCMEIWKTKTILSIPNFPARKMGQHLRMGPIWIRTQNSFVQIHEGKDELKMTLVSNLSKQANAINQDWKDRKKAGMELCLHCCGWHYRERIQAAVGTQTPKTLTADEDLGSRTMQVVTEVGLGFLPQGMVVDYSVETSRL